MSPAQAKLAAETHGGGSSNANYPGVTSDGADGLNISGAVSIGSAVSVITTEYPIWEQKDSNGDVVASMTVVCSDITDGSQDCAIKFYVMVAGTLTLDTTIDGP
jgi:hypothetical protein